MPFTMRTAEPRLVDGLVDLCAVLKARVGENTPIVIVEVGCYMGESARILLRELPCATLHCIDPWQTGYDPADPASSVDMAEVERQFDLWAKGEPRVVKWKGTSEFVGAAPALASVDVVYIDGLHTYDGVRADIAFWKPRTRIALCGHDYGYTDWLEPVTRGVNDGAGVPDHTFADSSWLKWV